MTVRRPALRWHGGKWKLAPWILAHMPAHRVYVEPFGGAASVLLRKKRSYAEVYNDLDGGIVNVFKVLRDPEQSARLLNHLALTPFARDEFVTFRETTGDPVEDARTLIARSFMGFGSNAHNRERSTGFRATSNRSGTTPAQDWANYPAALVDIIKRLAGVIIENRPAAEVILQHDTPETLHYCDPPYHFSTRTQGSVRDGYTCDMGDDEHVDFLELVGGLAGMVMISGYRCPVYDHALKDWHRFDVDAHADGARDRVESLWLNEPAHAKLRNRQAEMFSVSSLTAVER